MLTIESAKEYTRRTMGRPINSAHYTTVDCVPVVNVFFYSEQGIEWCMTVWVENGKLYGEC